MHPETKAEAFKGNQHAKVASDNSSFASATSYATEKNKRTVEHAAACGEALGDDLNDVAGTSLDKGVELDALAQVALCPLNVEVERYRFRRPNRCPAPAGI